MVVTLLVVCPERADADWFVTPYAGLKFGGTTTFFDPDEGASNTKLTVGVAGGFVSTGIFGVEADFGYSPRFFERSAGPLVVRSHVLTLMGNLIVTAPRTLTGYALRPYVSGGGGLITVGIEDLVEIFPVDTNLFGINIGGGASGGLTNRTSVRFDLRYFKTVSTEDEQSVGFGRTSLAFWRAAVGLTVR
jgi:hypothetical protein